MEKYSYDHLSIVKDSINNALKEDLNKDERYGFLKNLEIVEREMELIEKTFKDNDEEYLEFTQGVSKIQLENGGKLIDGGQRIDLTDLDKEETTKAVKELAEEYKEAIERQEEINKFNHEKRQEKVSKIDWFKIKYNDLSDSPSKGVLNIHTINMIE